MEVETANSTSCYEESVFLPGEPKQEQKVSKKKSSYNRSNVKMEDFLHKDIEHINAKQLRVLLPVMFQKMIYPEKDVNKTKVKGLWESENRPVDFPTGVVFRDPNNAKKMPLEDMRKFFCYLRQKIVKQSDYLQKQAAKNTWEKRVLPAESSFRVISENHDKKGVFHVDQQSELVLSEIDVMNTEETETVVSDPSACTPTPTTDVRSSLDYSLNFSDADQVTGEADIPSQRYIIEDDEGNQLTELIITTGSDTVMSDTISVSPTEGTSQPVSSQETTSDIGPTNIDGCKRFALETLSTLEQPYETFLKIFKDNYVVLASVRKIYLGLILPLYQGAESGDKQNCLELSSIATILLDIMKRFTFLGPSSDPTEELQNLETLIPKNEPEDSVPSVAYVVQVTSTEDTGQPDRQILNVTEQSNWGESSVQTESNQIISNNKMNTAEDSLASKYVESFCDISNKVSQLTENQHEVDVEQDLDIVINQNVAAYCHSFDEAQEQCDSFSGRIERPNAIPVVSKRRHVEEDITDYIMELEEEYIRGKCSTFHNIPSVVLDVAEISDDGGLGTSKQRRTSCRNRGRKSTSDLPGRRHTGKRQTCGRRKCTV